MADDQVVVNFRLTASVAQQRVRDAAVRSENIVWGDHALERMDQRGIMRQDVLRVLRSGYCDELPELTEYGEWKCKMTQKIRGARKAGAVVIILHDGRLFLKTIEWEDEK